MCTCDCSADVRASGDGAPVLALGKDGLPIVERAHLAEDAVADDAAHLREEARLDPVEASGDDLRGLLRARKRARKHERVFRRALRERFGHRASFWRERALVVLEISALGVAADLEEGHRSTLGCQCTSRSGRASMTVLSRAGTNARALPKRAALAARSRTSWSRRTHKTLRQHEHSCARADDARRTVRGEVGVSDERVE